MLNHFTKHFTKHYNWVKIIEAVILSCYVKCVIFDNFAKFTGKHLCWSLVFKKTWWPWKEYLLRSAEDICCWLLEIYFYNFKRFSKTENHAHAIRCIWPKFVKVHSLNFSYDHKDYANFDNAFSTITKIFPGPILNGKLIAHYRTVTNLKTLIGRGTS